MMMFAVAVPERIIADGKGEQYHKIFKGGIINDIDAEDRQGTQYQRQNRAVNSAGKRGGDAQGVPVEAFLHAANIQINHLMQQCCKNWRRLILRFSDVLVWVLLYGQTEPDGS